MAVEIGRTATDAAPTAHGRDSEQEVAAPTCSDDVTCVRRASDADGPGIGRVIATVFAEHRGCLFDPCEFPELAAIAAHFEARGGAVWVVEKSGMIVGCLAVARASDPSVYELFKVYLLPEVRGRGLAGAMLALAVEHARRGGGRRLRLWTDTRFLAGHAFYRRSGFRQIPVRRRLCDMSESWEYAFDLALEFPAAGAPS